MITSTGLRSEPGFNCGQECPALMLQRKRLPTKKYRTRLDTSFAYQVHF